ncbi:WD repeat-containing protein 36 [Phakopsora pachyrhizi]|nr:WD repeat-containing protein 36 [Phakopsora pachyrhizi]
MTTSIYAPFRSLGHVTTDVPFAIHSHSTKESAVVGVSKAQSDSQVILTSVGFGWALWTADGIKLLYVGPLTPAPITCLDFHSTGMVLAAVADRIYVYKRLKIVATLSTSEDFIATDSLNDESLKGTSRAVDRADVNDNIQQFISFGNQVVGLSTFGTKLWIWNFDRKEIHSTITLPYDFGKATTLVHPSTYLNIILVASNEGKIAVYNVQTVALVHIFESTIFTIPTKSRCRSDKVPITRMIQGPAVDIIAIGFADGWCCLVDIKYGDEILAVKMGTANSSNFSGSQISESITSIAFKSDGESQHLITSSSMGNVAIWNLSEDGRLLHTMLAVHDSGVSNVQFLPGQPVMVTSGGDNSVKLWLFETADGLPRLLTQRSGHRQPPKIIKYYGDDGKTILSTGLDRSLRNTSVVRDSRSFELSQGSLAKKASQLVAPISSLRLPLVTFMSFSTSRSKDWDDLLTCHQGSSQARSWSVQNKRIGKHSLSLREQKSHQIDPPGEVASCVCVTACGNYGLVGTPATGRVAMWNLQSGFKRREFVLPRSSETKRKGKDKETSKHVVGIEADALNRQVIIATKSGHLHFYDFVTTSLIKTVHATSGAASTLLQRDSGLLAVNCSEMRILILDIDTRQVIRELVGFSKPISDMTFTKDSRWLVASSDDSVIRTFDLPTGALIDAFKTHSIATSVSFSPTGDFLASAHVDSVGILLWANRAQFSEVSYRSLPENYDIPILENPSLEGAEDKEAEAIEESLRSDAWIMGPELKPEELLPKQDASGNYLITLSTLPKSKWHTLLNLEIIKARNKPKQPPKAPERAPFFIPTVAGTEPRLDVKKAGEGSFTLDSLEHGKKKRKLDLEDSTFVEVEFTRRLLNPGVDGNYTAFFDYARNLSPSALDLEIRSLSRSDHLISLIHALTAHLSTGQEFEMTQAMMSLLWKVHGRQLIGAEENLVISSGLVEEDGERVLEAMKKLLLAQEKASIRLNKLIDYGIGVAAFVRGSTGVV